MACKKLINSPERCVDDSLEGAVAVNPGLRLLEGHSRVVVRADIDRVVGDGKVTLLAGGGSGHEPAHAGYVGVGMLSAVVAGSIFTSPPPTSILAGIQAISGKSSGGGCLLLVANYTGDRLNFGLALERAKQQMIKTDAVVVGDDCAGTLTGTLVIVKNYTGDRLNFGLAVERIKAMGHQVETLVVGEDCSLKSRDKTAGRRGLCGTILIHKIAGALAERGDSLEKIAGVCRRAASKMGTIGLALSSCSVPGTGQLFEIQEDKMELGLGVHGEAGVKRMKVLSAREAVRTMIDHMTSADNNARLDIKPGDHVACMVNNLGGTSVLEMNIAAKEAICYLESKNIVAERVYCGTFITSLDMAGISISILHLDDTLRWCLDAPTAAVAWQCPLLPPGETVRVTPKLFRSQKLDKPERGGSVKNEALASGNSRLLYRILKNVCEWLVEAEVDLNTLDTHGGDGDCGTTLARGARAVLKQMQTIDSPGLPFHSPSLLAHSLASIVEREMGGSSGALYSLFLTSAGRFLMDYKEPTLQVWNQAFGAGLESIMRYGGAQPGDRTMVDSMVAAHDILKTNEKTAVEAFTAAVEAAEEAAESTKNMVARAGRASCVSAEHLSKPDPGAVATVIWLRAVLEAIQD